MCLSSSVVFWDIWKWMCALYTLPWKMRPQSDPWAERLQWDPSYPLPGWISFISNVTCNKLNVQSHKPTRMVSRHFSRVKDQGLRLTPITRRNHNPAHQKRKTAGPRWIMGNDARARCLMMLRKWGQCTAAQEMKVSECIIQGAGRGTLENIFKRTAEIIMSFNVWAKYWKGLKRLEKLISIELLKRAQNKSQ